MTMSNVNSQIQQMHQAMQAAQQNMAGLVNMPWPPGSAPFQKHAEWEAERQRARELEEAEDEARSALSDWKVWRTIWIAVGIVVGVAVTVFAMGRLLTPSQAQALIMSAFVLVPTSLSVRAYVRAKRARDRVTAIKVAQRPEQ